MIRPAEVRRETQTPVRGPGHRGPEHTTTSHADGVNEEMIRKPETKDRPGHQGPGQTVLAAAGVAETPDQQKQLGLLGGTPGAQTSH